ncbi:MAG TPA: hypothetical protein VH678_03140 [Xanthobacteraceae bacterium]|jgi:hypothetical protein
MAHTVIAPIVVSLGTARERHLAEFRSGVGRIVDDVEEVMRLVRRTTAPEQGNKVLVPVVVVYAGEP